MSTVTLRRLRPDLEAHLSRLEVGAATLDRDARKGRCILVELGIPLPRVRRRIFSLRAARTTSAATLEAGALSATRFLVWIMRIVRSPRLRSALRISRDCIADCATGAFAACVTLLAAALAILLIAPPD